MTITVQKFYKNTLNEEAPAMLKLHTLLDRSPAFLTSDDFIRSNEIIRTKWPIYVVIGHFVLTI